MGFDSQRELRALVARGRGRPPEVRSVPLVLRIPFSTKAQKHLKTRCFIYGGENGIRTHETG